MAVYMIYLHYCKNCDFIHMLSGHRTTCPGCNEPLTELKLNYMDYYQMDRESRNALLEKCREPEELKKITFVYKKHKFSKWYKEGGTRG